MDDGQRQGGDLVECHLRPKIGTQAYAYLFNQIHAETLRVYQDHCKDQLIGRPWSWWIYDDVQRWQPVDSLLVQAMKNAGWTGEQRRKVRRMSKGALKTFERELETRGKSSHPHNAKYVKLYREYTKLKVTNALKVLK